MAQNNNKTTKQKPNSYQNNIAPGHIDQKWNNLVSPTNNNKNNTRNNNKNNKNNNNNNNNNNNDTSNNNNLTSRVYNRIHKNCCATPSLTERACSLYVGVLTRAPLAFLILPLTITILLGSALRLQKEANNDDIVLLYTPQRGPHKQELAASAEHFPVLPTKFVAGRTFDLKNTPQVVFHRRDGKGLFSAQTIATLTAWNDAVLRDLPGISGNQAFFYEDLCFKYGQRSCSFRNQHLFLLNYTFEHPENIKSNLTFPRWRVLSATPAMYVGNLLGGVTLDPHDGKTVQNFTSIYLIYYLRFDTPELAIASRSWENGFERSLRENFVENLNSTFDVTYSHSKSLYWSLQDQGVRMIPRLIITIVILSIFTYVICHRIDIVEIDEKASKKVSIASTNSEYCCVECSKVVLEGYTTLANQCLCIHQRVIGSYVKQESFSKVDNGKNVDKIDDNAKKSMHESQEYSTRSTETLNGSLTHYRADPKKPDTFYLYHENAIDESSLEQSGKIAKNSKKKMKFSLSFVSSKPVLSLCGMMTAVSASVSTLGIWLYCGGSFVEVYLTMPFLIFAIGLDDMFIMMCSWNNISSGHMPVCRTAQTLAASLHTVTVTSLTSFLSFLVGSYSDMLSAKLFCYVTAIAFLLNYVYLLTFYLSCTYLSGIIEAHGLANTTLYFLHAFTFQEKYHELVYGNLHDSSHHSNNQCCCHPVRRSNFEPSRAKNTHEPNSIQSAEQTYNNYCEANKTYLRIHDNGLDKPVTEKSSSVDKFELNNCSTKNNERNNIDHGTNISTGNNLLRTRCQNGGTKIIKEFGPDSKSSSPSKFEPGSKNEKIQEFVRGEFVHTTLTTQLVESSASKDAIVHLIQKYYAPLILESWYRFGIGLIYISYLIGALIGITQVRDGLEIYKIGTNDHHSPQFFKDVYKNFYPKGQQVEVLVNNAPNLSYPLQRARLHQIVEGLETGPHSLGPAATDFFLREYERHLNRTDSIVEDTPTVWQAGLRNWATLNSNRKQILSDLHWIPAGKNETLACSRCRAKLVAFRFRVGIKNFSTTLEQRAVVAWFRSLHSLYPDLNITSYHMEWPFVDQYDIISHATMISIAAALACMAVVAALFFHSLYAVFWTLFSVTSIDLGVIGYMTIWGVNLDLISMMVIVMSVGLSVDYTAHIVHGFNSAHGSTVEKCRSALSCLGLPVLQGALTTIVGIIPMGVNYHGYILEVFFKITFLAIAIGMFHGCAVLPIAMSISDVLWTKMCDCCTSKHKVDT